MRFDLILMLILFCGCLGTTIDGAFAQDQPRDPEVTETDVFAPVAEVSEAHLREYVASLPPSRSALGGEADYSRLCQARDLIVEELIGFGLTPQLEPIEWNPHRSLFRAFARMRDGDGDGDDDDDDFEIDFDFEWHNVVVEIPGTTRPKEILLIGAHYDSVPGSPGADDNASGTAALLEIARVLGDHEFERTVRLVFFNLEEVGLVGSRHHARVAAERGEQIVGMMSLEMLGYYSDEPNSQRSPIPRIKWFFDPPRTGDMIVLVGTWSSRRFAIEVRRAMHAAAPDAKTYAFSLVPGRGWLVPDTRRSDQSPFWDIGVPALMMTDTANFRNPHYHQPTDTPDTLDYPRMTATVRGVVGAICEIAGLSSE